MNKNTTLLLSKIDELLEKWDDYDFCESPACHVYGDKVDGDHWLAMNLMWTVEAYKRSEYGRKMRAKENSIVRSHKEGKQ